MKSFIRDTLTIVITAAVIIVGLQFTAQKFVVDGPSMNSSLHDGQQVLVNKITYRFHEPVRGDVIVFHPPFNEREDYIKRIIGLPGESIEIVRGKVIVHEKSGNTIELDEPYATSSSRISFKGETIPADNYFVLGDNRDNSSDSRNDWTVPSENIIGKAWLSVWPPETWGTIPNYLLEN